MDPRVTIVVTPREEFRVAISAFQRLLDYTEGPYKLIYVDGASPWPVRRYLQLQQKQRPFHLIQTDHYLAPTEARSLALPHVDTEYVCFIDNNVSVTPNWLNCLLRCADETGAWAVGPLYCEQHPEPWRIHMAGGLAHIRQVNGRRAFCEMHRFSRQLLSISRAHLERQPTELVEYHCMLLRTEIFDLLGPQDARYLSSADSIDICLRLRERGYPVYLEPSALVSIQQRPRFRWADLPYFLLRWSDAWNRISLQCFREHWSIPHDDLWLRHHYHWLTTRRKLAWNWVIARMRKRLGWRNGGNLANRIIDTLSARAVHQYFKRRPDMRPFERSAGAPGVLTQEEWARLGYNPLIG